MLTGQLEQAVLDAGDEAAPLATAATRMAAMLFSHVLHASHARAEETRCSLARQFRHAAAYLGAGDVAVRVPEGYAWYALYPESYADTAHLWVTHQSGQCPQSEDFLGVGLRSMGTSLAIASNQNGIAEGLLEEAMAHHLIHDALRAALGELPVSTRIALCTCDEDEQCLCRTPAPGLLLRLLQAYDVAPHEALYVGDLQIDEEAGRRAGIRFM